MNTHCVLGTGLDSRHTMVSKKITMIPAHRMFIYFRIVHIDNVNLQQFRYEGNNKQIVCPPSH